MLPKHAGLVSDGGGPPGTLFANNAAREGHCFLSKWRSSPGGTHSDHNANYNGKERVLRSIFEGVGKRKTLKKKLVAQSFCLL